EQTQRQQSNEPKTIDEDTSLHEFFPLIFVGLFALICTGANVRLNRSHAKNFFSVNKIERPALEIKSRTGPFVGALLRTARPSSSPLPGLAVLPRQIRWCRSCRTTLEPALCVFLESETKSGARAAHVFAEAVSEAGVGLHVLIDPEGSAQRRAV